MVFENLRNKIKKNLEEKKIQNRRIKAANKVIEERALTAALKEKEKQSIKFAKERQKVLTKRKIEKLKSPQRISQSFFSGFEGVNSYGTPMGRKKIIGYSKSKGGEKKKPKTSSYSFKGLTNQSSKYDVLGF